MLLISLAATLWAWRSNQKQAFERARTRFHNEVERTRRAILFRLEVYEDGLYGTRSLFEANGDVTREVFREYIENLKLEQRYPGIQGIGFSQYLKPEELNAHIAAVRREGFPNYTVRPEGDREEYTSIVYLEPFDWRNQRAFGYDMFSEPVRQKAMEYARSTGTTAVSGKVILVQETNTDVQPGFLMYLPLYRKGVPLETAEQRRSALRGYIYSPFRVGDLLKELIQERPPLATFEFYAGETTDPESLMYRMQASASAASSRLTELSRFEVGGQTWTLRFFSSPEFDALVSENTNQFILPAGLAISFLLFGITISIAQTERRALRLADEITARLRESERSILALNEELTDALYRSEKLAITGRLMATVAHEINNPLEALMNLLYVLQTLPPGDPRAKEYVRQAQDQLAILSNISRQTLAPYRAAGFPVATNISELLDDVLSVFRAKLMALNIQVERQYPPSVQVTIYPSELRQVFTNLLANALDAMDRGGRLAIAVESRNEEVAVSISDNGCGIAPERMQSIFEPFFTTKGDKGVGVGLWIVKTILSKLGGTIDVQSSTAAHDHGTKFTVVVPRGAGEPVAYSSAQKARSPGNPPGNLP